jgi:heat shock protein HtpX
LYSGGMGYGSNRNNNSAGAMIIVIAVALLTWVVSFLIIRAISRYREFAADRGSAQMTGKPVELANALMKISGNMKNIPTRDLRQEEGLNAFFIIPALSGSTIGNLFSTHPPVQKRVQKLMEMEASMG